MVWEWFAFTMLMAVGQFSPGPDMVLLTRTSLGQGRSAGCWTALGIASGLAFHALVAVAGVASLMTQGGWLEMIMRWLAAFYLLWLACQLIGSALRAEGLKLGEFRAVSEMSRFSSWKRGLLCNLLNPKVAVFLAGVTAPFLVHRDGWEWPFILWLTIVVEGLLLWCLWVFLLQNSSIKQIYHRMASWFDLTFGLALLVIAVMLIYGVFASSPHR